MLLLQRGAVYSIVTWYKTTLHFRGWISPYQARYFETCVTKIQAAVRRHQTRSYVSYYTYCIHTAASRVQRLWISKKIRNVWKNLVLENKLKKSKADAENRAALISRRNTNRFAFDMETQ